MKRLFHLEAHCFVQSGVRFLSFLWRVVVHAFYYPSHGLVTCIQRYSMQVCNNKPKKSPLIVLLHRLLDRTLLQIFTGQRTKYWVLSCMQWSRMEPARSGSCLRTAFTDPRGRILGWWRGVFQGIWWDYHGLSDQWGRTTSEPLYRYGTENISLMQIMLCQWERLIWIANGCK